jgi:hypothetical protein
LEAVEFVDDVAQPAKSPKLATRMRGVRIIETFLVEGKN